MKISSQTFKSFKSFSVCSEKPLNSYLIQRLKNPIPIINSEIEWLLESFKFGGNTDRLGGFDEDFAKKLANVFSFHGMGSSEYEWGAVPNAIEMFNEKNIDQSLVFVNFELYLPKYKKYLYVICRKSHIRSIKFRLKALAETSHFKLLRKKRGLHLRDLCYLHECLESLILNQEPEYQGWIELDNPYFFFLNKEMCKKFLELFNSNSVDFIKKIK